MEELWMPIKGYEGLYEVSNKGKVKALERLVENNGGMQRKHERILRPSCSRGYQQVSLCREGIVSPFAVHRLVAMTFIPNPDEKPYVDHIDTNPSNNCVDNLRWVTQHENAMNPITRKKNSESKKGHPGYLKFHTEETKRKLSELHKNRIVSEETRQKLSKALKGRIISEETRAKISVARSGHEVTEETRNKIRKGMVGKHKGKHWRKEGGKRVWY